MGLFSTLKKNKRMKYLAILIILLTTTATYAQYPDTTYANRQERKIAWDITNAYNKELGLDGDQLPIFHQKIQDYLVRSNEIKAAYQGKAELDALTKLRVDQALDMKNLLTRQQYDVYKRISQNIQPVKQVGER